MFSVDQRTLRGRVPSIPKRGYEGGDYSTILRKTCEVALQALARSEGERKSSMRNKVCRGDMDEVVVVGDQDVAVAGPISRIVLCRRRTYHVHI